MNELIYKIIELSIIHYQNYKGFGYPSIIEEICRNNNLIFDLDFEYNGWEVDWWAEITTSEGKHYCNVSGSMYYGTINIEF